MGRRKSLGQLTAKDVMTTGVLCVHPDWPVEQLADFLVENAISGAPVTNADGELVGVVSLTDVARSDSQAADPRAAPLSGVHLFDPWGLVHEGIQFANGHSLPCKPREGRRHVAGVRAAGIRDSRGESLWIGPPLAQAPAGRRTIAGAAPSGPSGLSE